MHKLYKIAKMEFRRTAINKIFALLTICGPFLICLIAILPGFLTSSSAFRNTEKTKIAVVGADDGLFSAMESPFLQEKIVIVKSPNSIGQLHSEISAGAIDGYLVIPKDTNAEPIEYVSKNMTDFRIRDALESILRKSFMMRNFANAGINESEAGVIMRPPSFKMTNISKDGTTEESPDFAMIFTSSIILASLLYMTILFYGQAVGRSILMEKTGKTVEILLSSVRPVDILFGKILGNAIASLLQYGIWIAISMVLLKLIGSHFGFSLRTALTVGTYMYLLLFFILAYFLYCSIYAILGAVSVDEQQLAQLFIPVIVILIIPIMLITAIIASPQAPIVIALSLFPLTAPIVMFIRILLGAARSMEIVVSVFLMLAAIAGCAALSAKIFGSCILLNGKPINVDLRLWLFRDRVPDGKIK